MIWVLRVCIFLKESCNVLNNNLALPVDVVIYGYLNILPTIYIYIYIYCEIANNFSFPNIINLYLLLMPIAQLKQHFFKYWVCCQFARLMIANVLPYFYIFNYWWHHIELWFQCRWSIQDNSELVFNAF